MNDTASLRNAIFFTELMDRVDELILADADDRREVAEFLKRFGPKLGHLRLFESDEIAKYLKPEFERLSREVFGDDDYYASVTIRILATIREKMVLAGY